MNLRPSAAIRRNDNGNPVVMDMETYNKKETLLKLREELLAVEEDRMAGRPGCTLDNLDAYLDHVMTDF